jgi:PIN domain nuclease of toxin-antitoxin system
MLLDTCALLWLAAGGKDLSAEARSRIATAPGLHVSAISGFEIALKSRAGKLRLPATPSEWLHVVLRHHRIDAVPIDISICVAATELPAVHSDPCDRFIIATARIHGWPIVTADKRFQDYGVQVIW